MFKWFEQRAVEPELMDDFSKGGAELQEALKHLRMLNRIFGAASPTLYGIKRLWEKAGKPKHLSIVDVGCGSGDINRSVLRWAQRNKIDVKVTLVDITEEACAEAKKLFHNEPQVEVRQCHLYELPAEYADIVTGTQFVHHFNTEELPDLVKSMIRASRIGVVINDIHRHWIPWMAVWITVRLISNNRYILNDGPLSVAKGFRAKDWVQLRKELEKKELNIEQMVYVWRPLFRYAVIITKS